MIFALWFEEIQRDQGNKHIRLGIFLNVETVIGDVIRAFYENFIGCMFRAFILFVMKVLLYELF